MEQITTGQAAIIAVDAFQDAFRGNGGLPVAGGDAALENIKAVIGQYGARVETVDHHTPLNIGNLNAHFTDGKVKLKDLSGDTENMIDYQLAFPRLLLRIDPNGRDVVMVEAIINDVKYMFSYEDHANSASNWNSAFKYDEVLGYLQMQRAMRISAAVILGHPIDSASFGQTLWPDHALEEDTSLKPGFDMVQDKGMDDGSDSYSAAINAIGTLVWNEEKKTFLFKLNALVTQKGLSEIHLAGIATDFCVYNTAESIRIAQRIADLAKTSTRVEDINSFLENQILMRIDKNMSETMKGLLTATKDFRIEFIQNIIDTGSLIDPNLTIKVLLDCSAAINPDIEAIKKAYSAIGVEVVENSIA